MDEQISGLLYGIFNEIALINILTKYYINILDLSYAIYINEECGTGDSFAVANDIINNVFHFKFIEIECVISDGMTHICLRLDGLDSYKNHHLYICICYYIDNFISYYNYEPQIKSNMMKFIEDTLKQHQTNIIKQCNDNILYIRNGTFDGICY